MYQLRIGAREVLASHYAREELSQRDGRRSMHALRKASDTSYFKDKDALWVKVVSNGNGAGGPRGGGPGQGTSLQVSR